MRKLARIADQEFDVGAEVFDAGTRKLFATFTAKGVRVRAARTSAIRFLSWQQIYDRGVMAAADFDATPRTSTRVTRGRLG